MVKKQYILYCDPKINNICLLDLSDHQSIWSLYALLFKKDQLLASNQEKNYYLECIGKKKPINNTSIKKKNNLKIDKIYILQDTNKIHNDKFIFLPKLLDIFFNLINENKVNIVNHYLTKSETGYFFKFGTNQTNNNFLNSIAYILKIDLDDLIKHLIKGIENDNNDLLFTYLNNGDIRNYFKVRKNYINYLNKNDNIKFNLISDLISCENVFLKKD